jgi:Zn-dependent protease with chaperone function
MPRYFTTTIYRYPHEHLILFLTMVLVFLVVALTAAATVCTSVIFIGLIIGLSYYSARGHHQSLLGNARLITPSSEPELALVAGEAAVRLQVEPVQLFVVRSSKLNAYTFGLSAPKVVVLHSTLLKVMDRQEVQFIIGHEMGHVRLGHTWLNSLVGGMAGIPSSGGASLLLQMAFMSWNRACEFSADRAGLLACGSPAKAVTALIKLVAASQGAISPAALERALVRIDAEDDSFGNVIGELGSTHPLLIRRINQLKSYAASQQYLTLQRQFNQNLESWRAG